MVLSPQDVSEIANDYMKKSGISDFEIKEVTDKIYKWKVDLEALSGNYIIEISKSEGSVIKFEKL